MWTVRGLVRRPWGGRGYALAESSLWRWRKSSVDEAVAAFVRSGRQARLDHNDLEHLAHFATRSALRALREGNPQYVTDALGAISYLNTEDLDHRDVEDLDYRDVASVGYLTVCVARELGMPAPLDALARTNPAVAETLVGDEDEEGGVFLENLRNLTGERIVQTPGGPVLVTDMSDDEHPYRPDRDLIGLALRLAEAMQRKGIHVADVSILPSTLPAATVSPAFAAARAGIGGRVNVEGVSITLRGFVDVDIDLIEAATPEDAAVLAAGASADHGMPAGRLVGLIDGRFPRSLLPLVHELLATAPDDGAQR